MSANTNTSKLAHLWENKIHGSDEKGVRKSTGIDKPDELVVVKSFNKSTASATSSTDNSPVTVLKSKPSSMDVTTTSSSSQQVHTRGIVERFEKRASENIHEKPLAPVSPATGTGNLQSKTSTASATSTTVTPATTLVVGLRPIKSSESTSLSRRPSEALSRRASSFGNNAANMDEFMQKLDGLSLRVGQLERQVEMLESKCVANGNVVPNGSD